VSFETSFDLKPPKLEPKLVSALSETKRLFRLFRFYFKTASFGVLIKPKLTERNRNKPKQTKTSPCPVPGIVLYAASGRFCPTAACAVFGHVQPVLQLPADISVL
jgi:hypothetical protein